MSSRAVVDGLLAGLVIGVPPILNYGSPELIAKVVPDVGNLLIFTISLKIIWAFGGSFREKVCGSRYQRSFRWERCRRTSDNGGARWRLLGGYWNKEVYS